MQFCYWMRRLVVLLALGLSVFGHFANAAGLEVSLPTGHSAIRLDGVDARWQLVVTQIDASGKTIDVTRTASYDIQPPIAQIDSTGYLQPSANGQATLTVHYESSNCQVPLEITGQGVAQDVDFHNQVVPIFTKHGCNGGGCHGKASGQAGFKLSLLGFESPEDYEHLVIESRGRRLFPADPDKSLLLQKAINAAPHGGGKRLELDSHEYRILHRWIAAGMPYSEAPARTVQKISVYPEARQLERRGTQQLAVLATYSDGSTGDITATVQFESNNTDLATVDQRGWVELKDQSGDVAVMARYQGQVAVFRASVPLGIDVQQFPPTRNVVDQAVFAKLKTLGIPPSPISDDSSFIRRVTLDLCGRLPHPEETLSYLQSTDADKADVLVDRLLASEDYADFFARKWALILRNRRTDEGEQFASFAFHGWLKDSFHQNLPYDRMVTQLLTASGSVETNPALTWWREVAETDARTEDIAQLFLGQRLQCARCHHHPFEKWSQADYYRMAAFFSKVARKEGSTPDNPVFVSRVGGASATHPRTGQALSPSGLDTTPPQLQPTDDPRQALASWMTDPNNPFFARSLVNRYWKHLMGRGLVEPEDDMRVTNPPTNSELLDGLAQHFVQSGYDLKNLLRTICTSSAYRLSSDANQHNLGDTTGYSRYYPKRLQAEVLLDAIDQVMMTHTAFAPLPTGTRAVQLPDTGFSSYFLDVFGRPAGTTACECERTGEASLAQSLHLLNSKEIQSKLTQDAGRSASMQASSQPLAELVDELYMAALSRPATTAEQKTVADYLAARENSRRQAFEDVIWAVINSKEFLFNH
jgi:hypothetical protein